MPDYKKSAHYKIAPLSKLDLTSPVMKKRR